MCEPGSEKGSEKDRKGDRKGVRMNFLTSGTAMGGSSRNRDAALLHEERTTVAIAGGAVAVSSRRGRERL